MDPHKGLFNFSRLSWLKLVYLFSLVIILLYACLFSYTYISDLVGFEKSQLRVIREKELLRISKELDNEVTDGKTTLNNIRGYFEAYVQHPDAARLEQMQRDMSNAMAMNRNQYNCYFALEPEYAEKLSRHDAYIMTVKKDIRRLGSERYGRVDDRIVEFWHDPIYQTSRREVWYHIGKQSQGYEVSPVYFDTSYMKVWMFTIGIGIYEKDKFQGMLGLDILADSYFREVENTTLNNTGGMLVVDNHTRKILTTIQSGRETSPLNVVERNHTALPQPLNPLLKKSIKEMEYSNGHGDIYIMNALPLSNLPWTLVSFQNKNKVYAGIYRKVISILLFSGLLMVSSVLVLTILVRKLGRMITELAEAKTKAEEHALLLKQTQQKLLDAERLAVLGEFAGSVAHEIRNPLGVISGSAYFIKRRLKSDDEKIHLRLDEIMAHVDRTAEIIESILKLTRMAPPLLQPVGLQSLVENSIALCNLPQSVTVDTVLPEPDVRILGDREQLQMALKNIIKNAAQAMDGTGTVRIRTDQDPCARDGLVALRIEDRGPGIAPENLDKVFTPLFTTKAFGIGFGLSIVKMIVERHKGSVSVESDPGLGTAFIIHLPLENTKGRESANGKTGDRSRC